MALIDSAVAYWKLDESSGAASSSIGTNGLTNNNTVTYSAGKLNNGADFVAASNQSFTIANAPFSGTGAFSLSFWIKTSTTGTRKDIFSIGTASINASVQGLVRTDNKVYMEVYGQSTDATSTSTVTDGNWHHAVFVYTGSNIILYLDGALQESTAYSSYNIGTNGRMIGAPYFEAGSRWNGSMDEICIWTRAISADEIAELYRGGNINPYPFWKQIKNSNPSKRLTSF